MFLTKKLLIKLALVLVILIILMSVFLWFYYKQGDLGSNNNDDINISYKNNNSQGFNRGNNTNIPISNNNLNINQNILSISPQEVQLKSTIILFAERLGSYSTDTYNFSNLKEIRYLMTDRMKNEFDRLINSSSRQNNSDKEYYGITTKALSVKMPGIEEGDNTIEAVVSCQREETIGDKKPVSKIKYQNLTMKLIKSGDKWLVDEALWEN